MQRSLIRTFQLPPPEIWTTLISEFVIPDNVRGTIEDLEGALSEGNPFVIYFTVCQLLETIHLRRKRLM